MSNAEQQLLNQDSTVRFEALRTIVEGNLEDLALKCLPQVTKCLGDSHWKVRHDAVEVFNLLNLQAAPEVQAVGQFLSSSDPGVVAAAAYALAVIGEGAASEVAGLERTLEFEGEDKATLILSVAGVASKGPAYLRKPVCAAAMALSAVGAPGHQSVGKLVNLLKHQDAEIRAHAAKALGNMGKEGAKFETEVAALIHDKSTPVKVSAIAALGQMAVSAGASQAVGTSLAECLQSVLSSVRAAAVKSLGEMGDEAQPYLPQMAKLLEDKSPTVCANAMQAIANCGTVGEMYAGLVCRLFYAQKQAVRLSAIFAIQNFGMRGREFRDELVRLLEDEDADVASAALEVIQMMDAAPNDLEEVAAKLPIGLLFPGQGSQYEKMLGDVQDLPPVAEMLAKATRILEYDLLQLCLLGPEAELQRTSKCQPAMYVANLAAVEKLKLEKPSIMEQVRAVAGLSLGEYSALCVAGVWDFETGLRLVKLRGEAMHEAAQRSPQAMASVAGMDEEELEALCRECAQPGETCQIANRLFPLGFSCSGTKAAVELLSERAMAQGALQAKMLKIEGAFHTDLMKPARDRLIAALEEAEPQMKPTTMAVYMNVTGQMLPAGTLPSEIIPLLANQICSPVLWLESMQAMINDGITEFYECGPMKQLRAMMKRIDQGVWSNTTNIHV